MVIWKRKVPPAITEEFRVLTDLTGLWKSQRKSHLASGTGTRRGWNENRGENFLFILGERQNVTVRCSIPDGTFLVIFAEQKICDINVW